MVCYDTINDPSHKIQLAQESNKTTSHNFITPNKHIIHLIFTHKLSCSIRKEVSISKLDGWMDVKLKVLDSDFGCSKGLQFFIVLSQSYHGLHGKKFTSRHNFGS